MTFIFFSFFLNHEEAFFEINSNLLETNIFNILLLLGILVYAYKVSFSVSLEARQNEILRTIENVQNDISNATKYYFLAEKGFTQSFFWLQSWKTLYEKDKMEIVEAKYKQIKDGLLETFSTTENLISNFEKKSFLSLQRYILFLTASRILRKFLELSEIEQSKFLEKTISKLEEFKK
jgi:F0F1-type ATP synthase membrane subunit b/b'